MLDVPVLCVCPRCTCIAAAAPSEFVVFRRYGDFKELYSILAPIAKIARVKLPSFPSGGFMKFFNKNSDAVVQERAAAFRKILQAVTTSPNLYNRSTVRKFLQP